MDSLKVKQCPRSRNSYEWELREILSKDGKQASEPFLSHSFLWRLLCFPKQNIPVGKSISLFLEYPAAHHAPEHRLPAVDFALTVVNHKQSRKDLTRRASWAVSRDQVDWGFSEMIPLSDVSVERGYLREDGAMVFRVEVNVVNKICSLAPGLASDLLALLADPGPTSDLTLLAGGRSFPVHRTILAARCEFFKTLFASAFADSSARELPLPDVDPDALALLLRFIYGGVLDTCPRPLMKATAELADRFRLTDVRSELEECILYSTGPDTIVEDLLWAEVLGAEALLQLLLDDYLLFHAKVDEAALAALAERSPKLAARLLGMALVRIKGNPAS